MIRLGVAYYPEQDPAAEWEMDAVLMRELGLDCIRIGEFAWNRMQQPDGSITLDWLQELVELYDRHGIKTILCTPTATPPVWLVERYPDLAPMAPDGRRAEFGGRRHYSVFHRAYREHCVEIAAALAQRFGQHPAVIGWQLDNEAGAYFLVDCSSPAEAAFREWLTNRYASPAELNERWSLVFWNQCVDRFDQVPAPTKMVCTRSPSHVLEYNRFCLEGITDFLLAQAAAIREHAHPKQFIAACAIEPVLHTLAAKESTQGSRLIDAIPVHNYPELLPDMHETAFFLDRMRAVDPELPMLALEHQTGSGHTTHGALDAAPRRYWVFETLAAGAKAIVWFHWRRFRGGCEWRHTGVLERDRKPRATYRQLQQIIREVRSVESILATAEVVSDIQILYSLDNMLARDRASEAAFWLEIQEPEAWPTRAAMWRQEVWRAVYRPLVQLGWSPGFVREDQPWVPGQVLVIPDLDICTEAALAKLIGFCEDGGTVICFPGAGERDAYGANVATPPGRLKELFGVELDDYLPLPAGAAPAFDPAVQDPVARVADAGELLTKIRLHGECLPVDLRHAEALSPRASVVETLAVYAEGPLAERAAVTRCVVGAGQAIYLGAVPAPGMAAVRLFAALLNCSETVIDYRRVKLRTDAGQWEFLLNENAQAVPLPQPIEDRITGAPVNSLPAWGCVLKPVAANERKTCE